MLILRYKCSDVMTECLLLALNFFIVLPDFFGGLLLCWDELTVIEFTSL